MSHMMNIMAALMAAGIDVPRNRELNFIEVPRTELPKDTVERCEADRIKAADEKRARKAARKAGACK